ncbi:MAG: hypothetical protein P1V51_09705 [Deltaproteobacteria bacterium]|nr:hypothetical protein [Deltaproteobacteria bacterium]
MRSLLALTLGLTLLVPFASGCPSETDAVSCTGNADCPNDQRCVADFCEAVICDPGCQTGFECRHGTCACLEDASCQTGEVCDATGACVPDTTPPECTADDGCDPGEICVDNVCVASPSCAADADCPGARVCDAGVCVEACAQDGDCGSPAQAWACEAGHCSPRCLSDNGCPAGTICDLQGMGGICHPAECATLADCSGSNVICDSADHGRCQGITPCTADTDCTFGEWCGLPADCPPGYDCTAGNEYCVARPSCVVDIDCQAGEFCDQNFCFEATGCTTRADCGATFDCVGGLCVPGVCRGPADCAATEVCVGGTCVTEGGGAAVDRVAILSPGGVLLPGESRGLIAVVYDGNGDAIPGAIVTWASNATGSVDVDAAGTVTGGSTPGAATITAASGGQSDTVDFILLDPLGGDFRVTVLDGDTGDPVSTATVQVEPSSSSALEATVDATGVARFTMSSFPANVHVYDDAHDYVSLFGVTADDLVVPLPPQSNTGLVAGLTGSISYAQVTTTGDASVGLAGASFGQSLSDLDLGAVMGDTFVVTIPGLGQQMPLPGGMTAEASFGGFPIQLKTTWYARGEPGLRAVWAFGGKVGFDRFQGGGGAAGTLAGILPLFGLFEHGLEPRVLVSSQATIVDTADIDGDGNTTELVPDWNAFPRRTLTPAQAQTLRLHVDPAPMPTLAGAPTDTVILLAGVRSGRLGLTPLGLSATELENTGDTEAPPVTMRLTPVYGGLEVGQYQLLAMAASTSGGGGGFDMPTQASARVLTASNLPTDVALDPFLAFPEATAFAAGTRTLAAENASGADLHRERVAAAGRAWIIYGPQTGGNWVLPAPPSGMDDPAASPLQVTISVLELTAGDYQSLTAATGATLQSLDEVTAAYARFIQ